MNAPGVSQTSENVSTIGERIGAWLFSVVAVIIMPLLPLLVEASRNGLEIKSENLLLTSAVLATGFAFSSESNLFRASYTLLFFFSIGMDFHPEGVTGKVPVADLHNQSSGIVSANPNEWLFSHPGYFVIVVCVLHAIERLQWHVAKNRKFPDWLR